MARKIRKTKKDESTQKTKLGKSIGRASVTGLFGGLIWSSIGLVCFLLHFTTIGPSLIFSPFLLGEWKHQRLGEFLAILTISLLSVPIALVYQFLFSRIKSYWAGIVFGLALWLFVFVLLKPWIPDLPYVRQLGWNNLVTTLCLYILYGLFIGYSISFEMSESSNDENYSKA